MSPIACLSLLFCPILAPANGVAATHEYQNGFVERSLAVVVRDRRGFAEYSIGMNEQTAAGLLAEIRSRQEEAAASGRDPGQSEKIPESAEDLPAIQEADTAGAGQHLTDLKTIREFSGLATSWVAGNVVVTADQRKLELENIQIGPAQRHPYSLMLKFEFQLPEAPRSASGKPVPVELLVQDRLFGDRNGAVRHALKAQGDTLVLRTTVAPILVRATRIVLEGLSPEERKLADQLEARIAIADKDHE